MTFVPDQKAKSSNQRLFNYFTSLESFVVRNLIPQVEVGKLRFILLTQGPFSPEEQDLLYSWMQVHADTSLACSLVPRLSLLRKNHIILTNMHSRHVLQQYS